jgi:putative phage-type endonuclease
MGLTAEQIAKRRDGLGGTDMSVIFGVNPFKSELQLWMEKTGTGAGVKENLAMEIGTYMEEFNARKWCKNNKKKVRKHNEMIWSKKHPHLFANVDRLVVGEDALLECKTAGQYSGKKWDNGEIPIHYLMQVWHYLAVTEKETAYMACTIGNTQYVERTVNINDDIEIGTNDDGTPKTQKLKDFLPIMEAKAEAWYVKYVVGGEMPSNISCSDSDALLELYPNNINLEPVFIGDDLDKKIEALKSFKEEEKSLSGIIGKLENEIKAQIKSNTQLLGNLYSASWKSQGCAGSFDKNTFEKEYPGVYSKFYTAGKTRKLYISEIKKQEEK